MRRYMLCSHFFTISALFIVMCFICGCDTDHTVVTPDKPFSMAPRELSYTINAETGKLALVADRAMENLNPLMNPDSVDLVIELTVAAGENGMPDKVKTLYYSAPDTTTPAIDDLVDDLVDALACRAMELIAAAEEAGYVTDSIQSVTIDETTNLIETYSCLYTADSYTGEISFCEGVLVLEDTGVSYQFPSIKGTVDSIMTLEDVCEIADIQTIALLW